MEHTRCSLLKLQIQIWGSQEKKPYTFKMHQQTREACKGLHIYIN
jgi:hypothetical protein